MEERMITAKCIGGPYDGKLITKETNCFIFDVEKIEMGESRVIGRYKRYTSPYMGKKYVKWRWVKDCKHEYVWDNGYALCIKCGYRPN